MTLLIVISSLLLVLLITLNVYMLNIHYKLSNKCETMFSEINATFETLKMHIVNNQLNSYFHDIDKKNKENDFELKEINIPFECLVNNDHNIYETSLIEVSSDESSFYDDDESCNDDMNDYDDESCNDDYDKNYDNESCDDTHTPKDFASDVLKNNVKNIHFPLKIFNEMIEELDCVKLNNADVNNTNVNIEEDESNKKNEIIDTITINNIPDQMQSNLENLNNGEINDNINMPQNNSSEVLVQQKKKRESRKNIGDNDYKKMTLTDLRKYAIECGIIADVTKLKKPEIIKLIESNNKQSNHENVLDHNELEQASELEQSKELEQYIELKQHNESEQHNESKHHDE